MACWNCSCCLDWLVSDCFHMPTPNSAQNVPGQRFLAQMWWRDTNTKKDICSKKALTLEYNTSHPLHSNCLIKGWCGSKTFFIFLQLTIVLRQAWKVVNPSFKRKDVSYHDLAGDVTYFSVSKAVQLSGHRYAFPLREKIRVSEHEQNLTSSRNSTVNLYKELYHVVDSKRRIIRLLVEWGHLQCQLKIFMVIFQMSLDL